MQKVILDFETRSRADIWKCGAYVYANHESTEIMCIAYAVDDEPVKIIRWNDILLYSLNDPFVELRALAEDKNTLFYAHNALFEQLIWEAQLRNYDMPRMQIARFRCTAAKALSHGLPKALKDVAKALGSEEEKDIKGRNIMLKLCKPTKKGEWNEDPEDIRVLEDYCMQDVEAERAVDTQLPELSPMEQLVWFEDQLINQRGIAVDIDALDKCLGLIEEETVRLKNEIKKLTGGKLEGVSRRLAVLNYFKKEGVDLPDFTKATVEKAIKDGGIPQHLVEILRIRQQLGLTSTAKYKALKTAVCGDGRLRDTLLYHSASTGRWGGKLVQLQNLPRGTVKDTDTACELIKDSNIDTLHMVYGNVMGVLSSCVRGMFVSQPGYDLVVSDYSAIEARVLMWFCGQEDAVQMFRDGKDIYVEMAKKIGSGATRQLGKQAILGLGYNMGVEKFKIVCKTYKINVPDALAEKAVYTYRGTFSNVPAMWAAQDKAVRQALFTGKEIKCGMVKWIPSKNFMYCELPSGRRLAYHKMEVGSRDITYMTTSSTTKQYVKNKTYGGKLVENIIQAIARDILAYAMLKAEKAGYKIVLTVHDELVAEVPEGWGSVEEFNKIITATPAWAKGCPVNAEGWRGKRYKK